MKRKENQVRAVSLFFVYWKTLLQADQYLQQGSGAEQNCLKWRLFVV